MTERICEHCGQQFLAETIFDKLDNFCTSVGAIIATLYAVDDFAEGWHGLLRALLWLALTGGAAFELYRKGKKKEGKAVKLGRACPSCGDRTAHVDSPLGEQLIEHWSSPQTVDNQEIDAEQSMTPCEAEIQASQE
jgi:ribosomal protein S27AE